MLGSGDLLILQPRSTTIVPEQGTYLQDTPVGPSLHFTVLYSVMDESVLCNLVERWLYLHMKGRGYSTCKTAAASLDSHNELYSKKDKGGVLLQLSLTFLTLFSGEVTII